MNWKNLFFISLAFSTILTGVYFSLEWTTMESLGSWNLVIMLAIVAAPSFTFFSWIFQEADGDSEFEQYNEGYLKSVYNSFLEKLSEDPENKEILLSVYEAGKSYYSVAKKSNSEELIKKDIEKSIVPQKSVA